MGERGDGVCRGGPGTVGCSSLRQRHEAFVMEQFEVLGSSTQEVSQVRSEQEVGFTCEGQRW